MKTASPAAERVLHEVMTGRRQTLTTLGRTWFFGRLFTLSRTHVQDRRRQLAVFSFDYIGHRINIDGVFEKEELDTLFGWLSGLPGACEGDAVDVGANIGNHSLYFSDFYRHVYSFEPNPRTFRLLEVNAALAANVTCFECGISDRPHAANLDVHVNNIGHSEIVSDPTTTSVAVSLKTLDEVIDPDSVIRLIKFDVEGHEYQAIKGSLATIERHRPVILFEQLASELRHGTSDVMELLRGCGYHRFASVARHTRRLRSANPLVDLGCRFLNALPIAKSLLFGTSWTVQIQDHFASVDHPFIVAIPDWLAMADP